MPNKLPLLLLPFLISGCMSFVPDYNQKTDIIPTQFPTEGIYENNKAEEVVHEQLTWKNYIQNEKLKEVVKISLENNKDLKIALANIEAAKAQYGITQADTLPGINLGATGSKNRASNGINESFQASLGVTAFELDFFGRVSSLNSAALSTFLSTKEAQRVTELSVVSETAKAYFNIALAKSQLRISQKTETATKGSMELIKKRLEHGIATAKDLSDIESIYFLAQADVLNYKTQVEKSINALYALAGTQLKTDLLPNSVLDLETSVIPLNIAVNSDILFKRPDVISAEHQLIAANANIGAAKAAFFPRISLTTSLGVASSDLSNLFSDTFRVWNFTPSISIPIFDNSKNQANLKYSEAQKDKYIATYEKTVQTAFREVSDALARKSTINGQIEAYSNYVQANQKSFDLATKLYEAGAKDYLSVLTAQNNLYNAQKNSISLYKEKFDNSIELYKTIGY